MSGRLNSLNNGYVGSCIEIPTISVSTGVVTPRKQYIRSLEMDQWERPAYWLPLPGITEGVNRNGGEFAGLYAIFKGASGDTGRSADSNWVAFSVTSVFDNLISSGAFTVDWGITTPSRPDGVTIGYSSETVAQYQYNWNDVPASTETPEGYRQVIIKIYPYEGNLHYNLTGINLCQIPTGLSFPTNMAMSWLDIRVASPKATFFRFSQNTVARSPYLKQVEIVGETNIVNIQQMFASAHGLERVIGTKWSKNITNGGLMFLNCSSLRTIPLLDLRKNQSMEQFFSACTSLHTVPCIDTSNVTNMNLAFNSCFSLTDIPFLNTSNVTSMNSAFTATRSLETIPLLDTSKVRDFGICFRESGIKKLPPINTSSAIFMNTMFALTSRLFEIPLLDTSKVERMDGMFSTATALNSIPPLNTSKVKTFNSFAFDAFNLSNVPVLSFAGITGAFSSTTPVLGRMFGANRAITTIPDFDVSGISFGPTSASSSTGTGPFNEMFDGGGRNMSAVRVMGMKGAVRSLSLSNMCLSPTEIARIFTNLGGVTVYGGSTVNVTGVWGITSGVSGPDFGTLNRTNIISIATNKGWTVIG